MKHPASDPMTKKCIVASCVIMENGKVLLHKHRKFNNWLYFGGHIEENETPEEAAKREALEESGLNVEFIYSKNQSMINDSLAKEVALPFVIMLEDVHYKDGDHIHYDLVFVGKPYGKQSTIGEEESKEMKWFEESGIDSLDMFENARDIVHKAFKMNR